MPAIEYKRFTELFDAASADALLRLCERFGRYGHYSEESSAQQFGEGLFQRHDAVMNFLATGGISGHPGDARTLAARTNYFREEYAYGDKCFPGIEAFRGHACFAEGARELQPGGIPELDVLDRSPRDFSDARDIKVGA